VTKKTIELSPASGTDGGAAGVAVALGAVAALAIVSQAMRSKVQHGTDSTWKVERYRFLALMLLSNAKEDAGCESAAALTAP